MTAGQLGVRPEVILVVVPVRQIWDSVEGKSHAQDQYTTWTRKNKSGPNPEGSGPSVANDTRGVNR